MFFRCMICHKWWPTQAERNACEESHEWLKSHRLADKADEREGVSDGAKRGISNR